MSDDKFHVVITGETLGDAAPEQVAARLARLFRMPEDKARHLLGGGARVVKKDADEATARKFQVALRQAGARCELKPVGSSKPANPPERAVSSPSAAPAAPAAPEPAPEPAAPPPAPASPAQPFTGSEADDLETVGTIRTGGMGFSGAFQVAPVGAELDTADKPAPAPGPDTSHLSVAEPGADIETLKRDQPVAVPDISHLSLSGD